jgi:hypothetical protein
MKNFINRLFSKAQPQTLFPKISPSFRLEGIEYETENNSLHIVATILGERKIYTDSIDKWRNESKITDSEKKEIFSNVIQFVSKKGKRKPIITINIDHEKEFWEDLCSIHSDEINGIEYTSNQEIENFQYDMMLKSVQNNGTLVFDDKTVKTEAEFIEYWKNRKLK